MLPAKQTISKNKLFNFTDIEKIQSQNGRHIPDIPISSTRVHANRIELLNNYFFRESRLIFISKHNRFADYPLHTHQFTELNYMLSGSCRQIVNGKPVTLRQGDLLLIGIGSAHEIKALGKNDLLINILFKSNALSLEWLNQMKNNRNSFILYLLNLVLKKKETATYYVFRTEPVPEIRQILKMMIGEYYSEKNYSNAITLSLLPILFTLLARETERTQSDRPKSGNSYQNEKMLPLLQLIDEDYKDINLTKAAARLGYNKTYLGNLIKKQLGVTFTQLVLKRRLYQALLLLRATDLPVSDIAVESGFSNKTFFYKTFKKTFGYLPGEKRRGSASSEAKQTKPQS
ncbi:MAG: helix-turn-helix domain-containing protein [Sporolactobacillus sp.]|jgi:AraC-like DNA-binding protein|nr:helix-turn-helix domain-containing protein [Sporolactobacillus sp.]